MQLDLANLPTDTALLHRLVRDIAAAVEHKDNEIERLQSIIKQLQRMQFGRRSERIDPDQLALGLEDIDSDIGSIRCKNVFASDHLFADDTPVPVLDPGRGRTKTGRLWVYAREQRPWCGPEPPAAVYLFAHRKAERPAAHLADFKGVLHVDGYAGFEQLAINEDVVLAACWSHTRRKFYEVAEPAGSPVATEALRRIGTLYAIESRVRGQSSAHRLAERRSFSKPVVQALHSWLETQLLLVSGRSTLAEAIRYALSRWEGLTRFLHDGRIELDTNPVERAIRPVALGRKNHLFAGSDGDGHRWAVACSLITTCKLNDVEPYVYLRDVLQRMVDGHPVNQLDELLPWNWSSEGAPTTTVWAKPDSRQTANMGP